MGPAPRARLRSRLACRRRPTAPSASGRPNSSFSPCLAKTVPIFVPRAISAARSRVSTALDRIVVDGRVTVVTSPSRVVFTMITVHRALWLIRFGTLPSRNSLRPAIPALPTTRTSMSCSSVACTIARPDRRRSPRMRSRARPRSWSRRSGARRRRRGPRDLGRPVLGVRGMQRDHHLHDVELRRVGVRERGRPSHGPLGGLRAVRPDHHASDARRSTAPVSSCHDAASSQTRRSGEPWRPPRPSVPAAAGAS